MCKNIGQAGSSNQALFFAPLDKSTTRSVSLERQNHRILNDFLNHFSRHAFAHPRLASRHVPAPECFGRRLTRPCRRRVLSPQLLRALELIALPRSNRPSLLPRRTLIKLRQINTAAMLLFEDLQPHFELLDSSS